MVPPPATQLSCPKCKRGSVLPQEQAEGLQTNHYALNLAQLRRRWRRKTFSCWQFTLYPQWKILQIPFKQDFCWAIIILLRSHWIAGTSLVTMAMMKESMSSSSLTTGPCSSLAVTAGVFCCGPPAKQSIKTGSRNQLQLKPNTRSPSGVWPSVPITDGSSLQALTSDNKLLIDDDETWFLIAFL